MNKLKYSAFGLIVCLLISLLTFSAISAQGKIKLVTMGPTQVKAGVGFNIQPNGSSAMWVKTENARRSTVIVWDKTRLATNFVNANNITAGVPNQLFAKPGKYSVYLMDLKNNQKSNIMTVTVK